jgi:cysteine desulfurase
LDLPIYLDHHSTTPVAQPVLDAMWPYFAEKFGNAASRTHTFGLEARAAVELAREQVASLIHASPKEIVWTSGATESNNLAILGVAQAAGGGRVVTTTIEHKAVLDPVRHLEKHGFEVVEVPVGSDGRVDPADIARACRPGTVLVSVMLANNEIGTIQPVQEIGRIVHEAGAIFHVDASQAPGRLPIDVEAFYADLLSLSAHKMYGPKGVGVLRVRRGRPRIPMEPLFFGGGHERGLRSGTLPVPLVVGMGAAAVCMANDLANGEPERQITLRERLWNGLAVLGGATRNGHAEHRLPGNLNVSFDGIEAEALMMNLRREVAISSGSACSSETLEPSYVLRAIGLDDARAFASIRLGLGRGTTVDEIDRAVGHITKHVTALRALNGVSPHR